MKRIIFNLLLNLLFMPFTASLLMAQDSVTVSGLGASIKGQLSAWGHYNPLNTMQIQTAKRYILQLNSHIKLGKERMFDIEGSANLNSMMDIRTFDSVSFDWNVTPYRLWARYSTKQSEVRVGLQKINFGSATLLRPLMWFDQLDPRDPQQLTNGVWGLLGRYYFLNNTNIWLWGLYGNKEQRPWEIGTTYRKIPEIGGRLQVPVFKGEAAITYHYRQADMTFFSTAPSFTKDIPENRFGFDAKFDMEVGLWCEASWISKSKNVGVLTNQQLINIGTDYTFGIGNGLNAVLEHLIFSSDETAFNFGNTFNFSAISVNYPLSIDDHINIISFFDWNNKTIYNFANWKHQFGKIETHIMLYFNPDKYHLPQQGNTGIQFAGKGIQIMLLYKH